MEPMIKNASTTGIRHSSPSRQSNKNSKSDRCCTRHIFIRQLMCQISLCSGTGFIDNFTDPSAPSIIHKSKRQRQNILHHPQHFADQFPDEIKLISFLISSFRFRYLLMKAVALLILHSKLLQIFCNGTCHLSGKIRIIFPFAKRITPCFK